jgi:ketosteroid isomerase-like protein
VSPIRLAVTLVWLSGCAAGPRSGAGAPVNPADSSAMAAASELMQLEEAWGRALNARDTAFFRRTLGDDFVGTGGAETRSKTSVIAELTTGTDTVPVPRLEGTQVRLFGQVAVVTGLAAYAGAGGAPPSHTRFTEVWVKRAGRWQAVHGHYNSVPPRAP